MVGRGRGVIVIPRWASPGATSTEDLEWTEALRRMSSAERDAIIDQVCEIAESTAFAREDRVAVLAWQEPISASSNALLLRLRHRHDGSTS